jgi:hypothetical protein
VVKKRKINGLQIFCRKISITLIKEIRRTVELPCL